MQKVIKIVVGVGLLLFFLMLLIGGCATNLSTKDTPKEVPVAEPADDEEEAAEPAPKKKAEPKEDLKKEPLDTTSADEKAMLDIFRENFPDSEVTFEKKQKMYMIKLNDGPITTELAQMVSGTMGKEPWYNLVDATVSASNNVKSAVGPGYSISLTNPANEENIILLVTDGVVMYDIFAK